MDKDVVFEEKDIVVEDVVFESLKDKGRKYLETTLLTRFMADMQNDKHKTSGWLEGRYSSEFVAK